MVLRNKIPFPIKESYTSYQLRLLDVDSLLRMSVINLGYKEWSCEAESVACVLDINEAFTAATVPQDAKNNYRCC